MLQFSDEPYQFFEPKPSKPLIWLGQQINRFYALPGKEHRVTEVVVEGALEEVRALRSSGDRLLFVINHPTHSDPQVITEVHRRLGIPVCFMAAYDVFLRSRFNAWCMQRLGHFSIDREGNDRKAMTTAIDTLKQGKVALDIFPEGQVYLANDRVTPFLDGPAFIAIKAQQAIESGKVKVVPLSLKFTHLTDCRDRLIEIVAAAAQDGGYEFDRSRPLVESTLHLGSQVLASHLRRHGYADEIDPFAESIHSALEQIAGTIVEDLEASLKIDSKPDAPLVERVRKVRSAVHQIRMDGEKSASFPGIEEVADKAILAFRVLAYINPYLTEKPTLDRFSETVERIGEDHFSRMMGRTAPRRAIVRINEPLDVGEFLANAEGKPRNAIASLTATMERKVREGLDGINAAIDTPGERLVH